MSAERIELKQTLIDLNMPDSGAFRKSQIFSFLLNFFCSSFSLPLLRVGRVDSSTSQVVLAVRGTSFINIFNLCSSSSARWSVEVNRFKRVLKKTLRFFVEFIPKKWRLIFQIRLKCGQQERQKVHKFILKFVLNFITLLRSSQLHWQLGNQIAKFIANFGNSEQTSKPVHQKLCETLCNMLGKLLKKFGWIVHLYPSYLIHPPPPLPSPHAATWSWGSFAEAAMLLFR